MTAVAESLRTGSWAPGGVAAFQVSFADPGSHAARLVGWALEYLSPLDDWLDQLVGNETQVAQFATTWQHVEGELRGVDDDLRVSDARLDELRGRTARALRKRYDEIRDDLRNGGEWTGAVAASLALASKIVTAVHDAIIGALAELTAIVVDLFAFTLLPWEKWQNLVALHDHAMRFIEVIATLIERMFDAFVQLLRLLHALLPLIGDALLRLRELLGELIRVASPYVGLIGGGPIPGILGGAVDDLLARDPRVTELDPDALSPTQREAYDKANATTELSTLSDLVTANGFTDSIGGSDRSVVDIKQVLGPDGTYHWVVSLPSTQDWGLLKERFGDEFVDTLKDYPATNDLDSNIALMLLDNPVLATQYERAVLQAMSDAGIPPGGEVLYTGFSQGGIMAANLASTPNSPYTTIGVVTNGSPIDGFPIPPGVPVISFEHTGDIVPLLDGQGFSTGDAIGNLIGSHKKILLPPDGEAHNNATYVESVATYVDQLSQDYPQFFGTVVDQQQHTWTE